MVRSSQLLVKAAGPATRVDARRAGSFGVTFLREFEYECAMKTPDLMDEWRRELTLFFLLTRGNAEKRISVVRQR